MVTFITCAFYHNKKGKVTLFSVIFLLAHWLLNSNIHKNLQVQGAQQSSVWEPAPQRFWFSPAEGLRNLFSEPVSNVVLGLHLKKWNARLYLSLPYSLVVHFISASFFVLAALEQIQYLFSFPSIPGLIHSCVNSSLTLAFISATP